MSYQRAARWTRRWIDRFVADHEPLDDPERMKAFRQLNAQTELFGFLLHFDARSALADTGPYELPDGRVVIVRDHFLTAPPYHWAQVADGLPHCITQAMFFGPADDLRLTVNDLSTTFAEPANYHEHLTGAAVYVRDEIDTPASEIRLLTRRRAGRDHARGAAAHDEALLADLRDDAARPDHERRAELHRRADAVPLARAAGLWDEFRGEMGFDELHPLVSQAYYTFERGAAVELLPPVFTEGAAFPAVGPRATW